MTPTARLVQISAWSFSRNSTYKQCPRRAKYLYVDKLKESDVKTPALVNGSRVHYLAATWVSRVLPRWDKDSLPFRAELERLVKSKTIPRELETFKEEFAEARRRKGLVEQQWTLDKNWDFIEGKDAWFSPRAWLRVKVDLHWTEKRLCRIVDYKTGKWAEDHKLQRSLYALSAFIVYPDIEEVTAAHWYVDPGKEDIDRWTRADFAALKKEWTARTTAMLNDVTYAPSPSDKCCWCHFRKANSGPCEF